MLNLRLFLLTLKKYFKMIPAAIIGSIIPATFIVILAIFASKNIYKSEKLVKADVALVTNDLSDKNYSRAMNFVENMESTSSTVRFVRMDMDEALDKLDNGEIVGIMHLPDNVVHNILDGEESPIEIIFPKDVSISTVFLSELSKSAISFLATAQAGTFTLGDIYSDIDMYDSVYSAYDTVDLINLSYVLAREDLFTKKTVGVSGNTNIIAFYIASGILIFMLFLGCAFSNTLKYDEAPFMMLLHSNKVRSAFYILYKLIGYTLCLFIFLTAGICSIKAFVKNNEIANISINAKTILMILLISALIASFTLMIFQIVNSPSASVLLLFLLGSIMSIISGCIIPKVFFPDAVSAIGAHLPTGYIHKGLLTILGGGKYSGIIPMLIYVFAFYEISVIFAMVNKRRAR